MNQIMYINKKKRKIKLKIKSTSIATLRSPHVDKRGIDQFIKILYKEI